MRHVDSRRIAVGLAIAAVVAMNTGCGDKTNAPTDLEHDHGDGLIQTTVWSSTHEAFVELPHLLAGVPEDVFIHLTDLHAAGPVTSGSLTLEWSDESGASFVRVVSSPERPGFYRAEVLIPSPGYWHLLLTPEGAAEPVVIDGIHVVTNPIEALHDHAEITDPVDDVITMTKPQQWRLGTVSTPVRRETFTTQVRVAATVEAPPERRVVVVTPVPGRVTLVPGRGLVVLGDRVTAGEALVAIRVPLTGDGSALAGAEADLVRAQQDLQLAEAELERARALVAADAAPARRVEEAEADVTAARARFEASRRLLAGDSDAPEMVLCAPIDGVVVAVNASPGEHIEAGDSVLTVLDPTRVWVRGRIPETALHDLPPEPVARLGMHGDVNQVCDVEGATLVYLAPEIDPASRTASVVYALDNIDNHLRVGQSLGLSLDTRTSVDGLVIPTSALVDEHGRPVVFVQTAGEIFIKRHVTVGGNDGSRCLILSGLTEGERVVARAAWAVKLAGADTAAPAHGHAH